MIRQLIRKRLERVLQTNNLFGRHNAGDVQGENDCQWTSLALTFLDLEKRDVLLRAVGVDFEVFLSKIANRATLAVDRRHIDRDEIGLDAQNIFRFLFFWKYFSRSLSLGGGGILVLR